MTPAVGMYLEHAGLTLSQAREAGSAALRTARSSKASFAVGFLTGHEVEWLCHVTSVLSEELRTTDFRVTSDSSPAIGAAVQLGDIDLGFARRLPGEGKTAALRMHELCRY